MSLRRSRRTFLPRASRLGLAVVLLGSLAVERARADDGKLAAATAESTGTALADAAQASSGLSGTDGSPKNVEPDDKKISATPDTRPTTRRARRVTPLAPPSDAAVKTLEQFQQEATEYEESARDYRATLTVVVRHHYEEQRRRILEALDQEIHEGQRQVKDTREDAIERLEQFVAKYSGSNADPHATPDAMFRLAALYEERARTDQDGNLSTGLQPAMALYRKIIETFPNYEELAGVAYYLGHAYTDSGRLEQGQQAWRSLVCKNRFPIVGDPSDPSQIVVAALPQDHPEQFWTNWYNRNPVPLDQLPERQANSAGTPRAPSLALGGVGVKREELSFQD